MCWDKVSGVLDLGHFWTLRVWGFVPSHCTDKVVPHRHQFNSDHECHQLGRVWGLGFRLWVWEKVWRFGVTVDGSRFRVQGLIRVQDLS